MWSLGTGEMIEDVEKYVPKKPPIAESKVPEDFFL